MLVSGSLKSFIETRWLERGREPFELLTSCPLCGSTNLRSLFTKWDFDHLECQKCDLVFVAKESSPEFLNDLYENFEYFTAKVRLVEKPRLERGETFNFTLNVDQWYQSILDYILDSHQQGMWLDVGGGIGGLLHFFKKNAPGFETRLCESNTLATQSAEKYCDTKTVSWEELENCDGVFQVITCIAVFEHVPDSLEIIQRIGRLLAPGGILYMTMPRLGYLGRHVSRVALYDVAPPKHLRFFSDKSLRYLESQIDDETLRLSGLRESHGKTFQFGHLFKPQWHQFDDVFPEHEGDSPQRVVSASPSTVFERFAFQVFRLLDGLLAPLSKAIDKQRVLHAVWQKNI